MDPYEDLIKKSLNEQHIEFYEYSCFKDVKLIGEGGYGKVYSAILKSNEITVAIKSFKNNVAIREVVKELKLHRRVDMHSNIIRLHGATKNEDKTNPNSIHYMLVLEYADSGTLRSYLQNNFIHLSWNDKINFALQIVSAVKSLHTEDIVHRDLNSSLKIKPKQQIINRYFSSKPLLFSSEPLNQNILIQKKKIPRGKEKSSNADTLSPQTKKVLKSLGILSAGFGYKDLNAFKAWHMRLQARTNDITHFFTEPSSDKLLPDRDTIPSLPPLTLVINLDQTLIYSTWDRKHGWRTAKRPGVDYFLYAASNLFEVVIFTSQPSYVAEQILAKLDPLGMVPFRLFRESTRYVEGKDISKLNRDLSKVIVMDSNPDAYSLQPENVITVPPWTGDPNDTYLVDIIPFLEGISLLLSEVQDIRPVVKEFQGKNVTKFYPEWEEQWKTKHQLEWEKAKPKKEGLARFVSMIGGSQVHEQVMPQYQQALIHRQMVHSELLEHYKSIKDRGPELQRAIDDYEKKIQESMKEQKITHWQLLTKGPPQIPFPQPDQPLPPQSQ
ncbi:4704_t:CDS:10 [Dentiscutata heterogama]|uniref:4704_t:CDS:1 n=1 Tax=Dentiscutata heterogama TaxID=1316150 RepID=A0ACA9K8W1_9GLOM|nr:4704_t:CDS:10 [Dentiscutata heterogama]